MATVDWFSTTLCYFSTLDSVPCLCFLFCVNKNILSWRNGRTWVWILIFIVFLIALYHPWCRCDLTYPTLRLAVCLLLPLINLLSSLCIFCVRVATVLCLRRQYSASTLLFHISKEIIKNWCLTISCIPSLLSSILAAESF